MADARTAPFAPYRRVGTALAVTVLLFALAELAANARDPTDRDFIAFWAAAKLALAGSPAAAYDNGALHAVQAEAVRFTRPAAQMPFAYPPAFLALVLPFGWLSFPAALAAWVVVSLAAFVLAVRRMFPRSGLLALAFPPVLVNAALGQNGFVTAALLVGGLALLPRRPLAAGLLLGALAVKPQLALLVPVALLAGSHWRAIAGAAASAAAVLLVGLAAFGPEATRAWLGQMPLYAEIAREGLVGWPRLASVYAAGRQAGLPAEPALALHLAVAAAAALTVWRVWRSQAEPLAKASVLCAASMLASPYLFLYDALILAVPLLWLAARGAPPALVGALWLLPAVTIAQSFGFEGPVNLMPLLPLALLAIAWREAAPQYRARMNSRARPYS
ncbi:MAG TPA: glycosyltransferase family 87 protein [Sphingomicrobium sp.]|nr:glycosyltransferase family 87 protein [Sphingomicrobium sp.]